MNRNDKSEEKEVEGYCDFLKYDQNHLLIVCRVEEEGINWLKEIREEIIIKDASYLYNYRIQPVNNGDKIEIKGSGSYISFYTPKILDFSKNTEFIDVLLCVGNNQYYNGITFIENEGNLPCEKIKENYIECKVTKEHFKGKKSGYYFIKHDSHSGMKVDSYEVPPMKVILYSSKGNIISLSLFYFLLLLLIIV